MALTDRSKQTFTLRLGRSQDKDDVEHICRGTWSWGDYVPDLWDEWVNDSTGRLLVGEERGIIVGFVHLKYLGGSRAWLEGLRVDPERRREGFGRALVQASIFHLAKLRIKSLSLAVSSKNPPAISLFQGLGFKRETEFSEFETKDRREDLREDIAVAGPGDRKQIELFLSRSEVFTRSSRLYNYRWRWYRLDGHALRDFLSQGLATMIVRDGTVHALALLGLYESIGGRGLCGQTCYVDGDEDSAADIWRGVLSWATARAIATCHLTACADEGIIAGAQKAGLRERGRMLVYSLTLTPSKSVS